MSVCVCAPCLGSDHLVCFSPGFPFAKSSRDGCSLGTFSRFDLFLQPILHGKAEAQTDSANRSRLETEGAGFIHCRFIVGHSRPERGQYCASKQAEIVSVVGDRDTLFLELRRSGCAMLRGRARSRREQDKAPAASHQQRLRSTLLASPVHFRPHRGPHDPEYSSKRLHPSYPFPGAPPRGLPTSPDRGRAGSRGRARVGRQQTRTSVSLRAVRDRPPDGAIRRQPPCDRGARGAAEHLLPRSIPRAVSSAPVRSLSFCCPPPALPFAAPQRHKAQLPAVPRCHEMHQVEIQSPRCVCGRNLWQLLRNFL